MKKTLRKKLVNLGKYLHKSDFRGIVGMRKGNLHIWIIAVGQCEADDEEEEETFETMDIAEDKELTTESLSEEAKLERLYV